MTVKTSFLFILTILFFSCNNDCLDSSFSDIIVDQWEIENPIGLTIDEDMVTFNQDGTGIGTDNGSFFTSSLQGSSKEFSWTIDENQEELSLIYTNGISEVYAVTFLDCREVHLDFDIAVLTLRK